jgi:hypothetical protein
MSTERWTGTRWAIRLPSATHPSATHPSETLWASGGEIAWTDRKSASLYVTREAAIVALANMNERWRRDGRLVRITRKPREAPLNGWALVTQQRDAALAEVARLRDEVDALRKIELVDAQVAIEWARDERDNALAEVQRASARAEDYKRTLENLKGELASLKAEVERLKGELATKSEPLSREISHKFEDVGRAARKAAFEEALQSIAGRRNAVTARDGRNGEYDRGETAGYKDLEVWLRARIAECEAGAPAESTSLDCVAHCVFVFHMTGGRHRTDCPVYDERCSCGRGNRLGQHAIGCCCGMKNRSRKLLADPRVLACVEAAKKGAT